MKTNDPAIPARWFKEQLHPGRDFLKTAPNPKTLCLT